MFFFSGSMLITTNLAKIQRSSPPLLRNSHQSMLAQTLTQVPSNRVPCELWETGTRAIMAVVRKPCSNLGSLYIFFCSKAFPRVIFSILYGASNHYIPGKKNLKWRQPNCCFIHDKNINIDNKTAEIKATWGFQIFQTDNLIIIIIIKNW